MSTKRQRRTPYPSNYEIEMLRLVRILQNESPTCQVLEGDDMFLVECGSTIIEAERRPSQSARIPEFKEKLVKEGLMPEHVHVDRSDRAKRFRRELVMDALHDGPKYTNDLGMMLIEADELMSSSGVKAMLEMMEQAGDVEEVEKRGRGQMWAIPSHPEPRPQDKDRFVQATPVQSTFDDASIGADRVKLQAPDTFNWDLWNARAITKAVELMNEPSGAALTDLMDTLVEAVNAGKAQRS